MASLGHKKVNQLEDLSRLLNGCSQVFLGGGFAQGDFFTECPGVLFITVSKTVYVQSVVCDTLLKELAFSKPILSNRYKRSKYNQGCCFEMSS